jgi:bifunctional DNase/RNase
MKTLDVLGVRVEMPTNQPIVLLRERGGDRYLPIWIGAAEATAIAFAQQGVVPPRPLTHDLLVNVIAELGHRLTRVRIVALVDGVFHAVLDVDGGAAKGGTDIESRSSDAIALALRTGVEIVAEESLLEEAGVVMAGEQEDDEVEKFKEFLDQVSPEDFDTGTAGDEPSERQN